MKYLGTGRNKEGLKTLMYVEAPNSQEAMARALRGGWRRFGVWWSRINPANRP